ncbi:hypothetical protein ScPMuIL_017014 [Solemya velum]
MSGHDSDVLNFGKLEREVHDAMSADSKYWVENDAKIRAVTQKVGSYDEFRDIVLAAHLKPLEKDDKFTDIKFQQTWNSLAPKSKDVPTTSPDAATFKDSVKLPQTGQEFVQEWRRHHKTTDKQYIYLLRIGAECLSRIFKTEISFGLLGDFLIALNTEFSAGDSESVLAILQHLSQVGRFSLSVQFLSKKEKESCENLFKRLKSCHSVELCDLENAYGIKRSEL